MTPKKVLFFTAGPIATPSEKTALDALIAGMYTVEQRNGSVSASFGVGRNEPTDFVAGTVPAAFADVPVWSGSGEIPDPEPEPNLVLKQAAMGTFVPDMVNADKANVYGGFSYVMQLPAGGNVYEFEYPNWSVVNNVETNGTGVLVIDDFGIVVDGVNTKGVLTKARAEIGETAIVTVTLPNTPVDRKNVRVNVELHDTGGFKQFQFFGHMAGSKATVGNNLGAIPHNCGTLDGGNWTALATSPQSAAVLPVRVRSLHSGKVLVVDGSSSSVGRSDNQTAIGKGEQGYFHRSAAKSNVPIINIGLSGDRIQARLASNTRRIGLGVNATHWVILNAGNDQTDSTSIPTNRTAAQIIADLTAYVALIKQTYPAMKIMLELLTPVVSGTYATLAGQTVHPSNSIRIAINNAIKAGIPGVDMWCNANAGIENDPVNQDGKFKVTGGLQRTNDGTHCNSLGYEDAVTAIDSQMVTFLAL